jgi:hypothetical protein
MIAINTVATWLALTAVGFAALSALGRIELGADPETGQAPVEPREPVFDTWPAMPGVSPR